MVLCEFAMFPTDKGASVGTFVAKVIDYIDNSGITYQLTPMGTIIEGNWADVIAVIDGCYKTLEPHSDRIYATVKVDYRKTEESRMHSKIDKISATLGREIKSKP